MVGLKSLRMMKTSIGVGRAGSSTVVAPTANGKLKAGDTEYDAGRLGKL